MPNATLLLLLAYTAASLLHFSHNAEYLADYPNLPLWLSRAMIYLTWLGLLLIGWAGYTLFRRDRVLPGLSLLVVYTALGFDGLLHYHQAPLAAHSAGMNVTIWLEVTTAAAALLQLLMVASRRLYADR